MERERSAATMVSFKPIRRGDWMIKLSVLGSRQVLLMAHHHYNVDDFRMRYFSNPDDAAKYIDFLLLSENPDSESN